MPKIVTFTCPVCGSHDLVRIQTYPILRVWVDHEGKIRRTYSFGCIHHKEVCGGCGYSPTEQDFKNMPVKEED